MLTHMADFVGRQFMKPVRIAEPPEIPGIQEDYNAHFYTCAYGMLKLEMEEHRKSYYKTNLNGKASFISKLINWLKFGG